MEQRCNRFSTLYEQTLPEFIEQPHIVIGCGAIGGVICQILGQIGVREVHLWDPDKVEGANLGPQGFYQTDAESMELKVNARHRLMRLLSRDMDIKRNSRRFPRRERHPEKAFWWLMVDDLNARELIFDTAQDFSPKKIIDARMGGMAYEVYNAMAKPPEKYLETIQYARDNPVIDGCN